MKYFSLFLDKSPYDNNMKNIAIFYAKDKAI